MARAPQDMKQTRRGSQALHQSGFVLPLVVIVGLFLMIGGMTMLARTFGALRGANRNQQSKQAQQIAETGIDVMVDRLNQKDPHRRYLLINCYDRTGSNIFSTSSSCSNTGTWSSVSNAVQFPGAICSNTSSDAATYLDVGEDNAFSSNGTTSSPVGQWRVDSYEYTGNRFYGGLGKLTVTGERRNSDGVVLATAKIVQTMDIRAKPCNEVFGTTSGAAFPGLLGINSIDLGNNDVLGAVGGNVYCLDCDDGIEQEPNSIVHGEKITGSLVMPALPSFPDDLDGITNPESVTATGTYNRINIKFAGRIGSNTTFNPVCETLPDNDGNSSITDCPPALRDGRGGPVCAVDSNNVSHCRLTNISLAGNAQITIDSSNGPVRFYIENFITLAGNTGLIHDTGGPEDFGMFGAPASTCPDATFDSWSFKGNGNSTNAFIYGPCIKLEFDGAGSGGADNTIADSCYSTKVCSGGDLHGAAWVKTYNGSNTNNAEITVPDNISAIIKDEYGVSFAGTNDFVAIGVRNWESFQQ